MIKPASSIYNDTKRGQRWIKLKRGRPAPAASLRFGLIDRCHRFAAQTTSRVSVTPHPFALSELLGIRREVANCAVSAIGDLPVRVRPVLKHARSMPDSADLMLHGVPRRRTAECP